MMYVLLCRFNLFFFLEIKGVKLELHKVLKMVLWVEPPSRMVLFKNALFTSYQPFGVFHNLLKLFQTAHPIRFFFQLLDFSIYMTL